MLNLYVNQITDVHVSLLNHTTAKATPFVLVCPVAYKIKCDKDIKAPFHPSLDSTDLKTCTKCPNWSPCLYSELQRAVVESGFPWFRPKTQSKVNFLGGSFNLPKFPNSTIEGLIPLGLGCYDETL